MWNRTLVYLGLREEPEDGYDDLPERVSDDDPPAERGTRPRPATARGDTEHAGASLESNVRALRTGDVHVRAVSPSSLTRAAVIEVREFEDVESIGSRYRTGQPVVFDVSGVDAVVGRRVVDFVSGLTFALRGRLTKVGTRAFLLVPDGVELPADERRRLDDLGYRLPTGSDA
jgi:cell division inhibitor SepF